MTFSLIAAGSREQVQRQMQSQLAQHIEWKNDPFQMQAVIDLVEHHLERGQFKGGVLVESGGHLDGFGGYGGALTLTIKPLNIPAEKEGQL